MTQTSLQEKIHAETLSEREISLVCSRIDVRQKLYIAYKDNSFNDPELASGLLKEPEVQKLFNIFLESLQSYQNPLRHKCLNTMLKLADGILGMPVCNNSEKEKLNEIVRSLSIVTLPGGIPLCFDSPQSGQSTEILDIILLYHPSPVGNAYLYGLVSSGYMPAKILILPNQNPSNLRSKLSPRQLVRTGLSRVKQLLVQGAFIEQRVSCSPFALRGVKIDRERYFRNIIDIFSFPDVVSTSYQINSPELCDQINA